MSDEQDEFVPVTEFNYTLLVPFKIAQSSGEFADTEFITLKAPTAKVIAETSALKQAFFRASQETGDDAESKDVEVTPDIHGHDVISLLSISSTVDMPEIMEIAKKLFMAPGIAMVGGDTKFKQEMFSRMSVDDFETMLGEYLVRFVLASSLKRMQQKLGQRSQT